MTRAEEAASKHSCALCDIDVRHCGLRKSPRNCKDCKLFILGYEQAVRNTTSRAIEWIIANTCMSVYEQEELRKFLEVDR